MSYVKRCDEMERKLRYFEGELAKFNIKASVCIRTNQRDCLALLLMCA